MIKPLKNMWVCVRDGEVSLHTYHITQKDSIKELLKGGTMDWQQAKSYGWQCIKVNIELKPVIK